jgi:hypothetical protein
VGGLPARLPRWISQHVPQWSPAGAWVLICSVEQESAALTSQPASP